MSEALTAFGLLAVAELGDKSQLLALALATRYRAWQVLVGIGVAAATLLGVATALGGALGDVLPQRPLAIGAGLLFLGFAVWTWREDPDPTGEGEAARIRPIGSSLVTVTVAFLLAELGDKSMLVAATLAATGTPVIVWAAGTAALVATATVAIVVGRLLHRRLPAHRLRQLSALAFLVFGVLLLLDGVRP